MPLTRQDALRLLRFCLGPDDSGSIEVADDGAALVTISPAEPSIGVRTFEASTFDAALRMAVDAGLLKAACVEKQILFLEGGQPRGVEGSAAAPPRRFRPDLFPKLMSAMSGLLHETQTERGMSAIAAASSGRIFRRELSRQRERMDARRERFVTLWREVGDVQREGAMMARLAGYVCKIVGCDGCIAFVEIIAECVCHRNKFHILLGEQSLGNGARSTATASDDRNFYCIVSI